MTEEIGNRWRMAAIGAAGAGLLWLVVEAADGGQIGNRTALVLFALACTSLAATLAMTGPIPLRRALPRALGLGLVTAALVWLGGLWHADGIVGSTLSGLAAVTVAALPVPFLIAGATTGWRDYPALFLQAWSCAVRLAAAGAFTGVVWGVIFLSDAVLKIVGISVISDLLDHWLVVMLITGATFGLALAVVHDLAAYVSPDLVLRLFRLLLPVVLAVMLVFLAVLPFRGLTGLVSGLSPALLLLTMVAAGIALVAISIDQTDAEAAQSPVLVRAAQGMSLILPVLALLAGWALWQRIDQHGWTPERVFAALLSGLGLAYGLLYAGAVLRGPGWRDRIRQGNIRMALLVILLAALWLTPVLNAQRISAQDQLARFDAGRTAVEALDIDALSRWGYPGAKVLAALAERTKAPGNEALAARLDGTAAPTGGSVTPADLAALVPVQPKGATGTRDMLLAAAVDFQLRDWAGLCARKTTTGQPACLMLVADLLPTRPGEEALLVIGPDGDYQDVIGLYLDDVGELATRAVYRADGGFAGAADAAALLRDWREAPPPLSPAPINQLGTGGAGLLFLP